MDFLSSVMATALSLGYSNDQVRQMILEYFYDRNKKASGRKGKRGSHVRIIDIRSDLKSLYGFKAKGKIRVGISAKEGYISFSRNNEGVACQEDQEPICNKKRSANEAILRSLPQSIAKQS